MKHSSLILLLLTASLGTTMPCQSGDIDPVPYPAKNVKDAKKRAGFIAELEPKPKVIAVEASQLSIADCWIERVKVRKGRNISHPDFYRICFVLKSQNEPNWREGTNIDFGCFDCPKGILTEGANYSKASVVHTINLTPGREPRSLSLGLRKGNAVDSALFKIDLPNLP